jgi:hypothetical protein
MDAAAGDAAVGLVVAGLAVIGVAAKPVVIVVAVVCKNGDAFSPLPMTM